MPPRPSDASAHRECASGCRVSPRPGQAVEGVLARARADGVRAKRATSGTSRAAHTGERARACLVRIAGKAQRAVAPDVVAGLGVLVGRVRRVVDDVVRHSCSAVSKMRAARPRRTWAGPRSSVTPRGPRCLRAHGASRWTRQAAHFGAAALTTARDLGSAGMRLCVLPAVAGRERESGRSMPAAPAATCCFAAFLPNGTGEVGMAVCGLASQFGRAFSSPEPADIRARGKRRERDTPGEKRCSRRGGRPAPP